ncbi:MAG: hypothetical protein GXY24_07215 [Bacteroidales bacterium]|jgi:hypothetical protein|nr:hypothetical protein [Bacteroidales bacterium]
MYFVEILVPIAICVVLPVLIVWLIGRVRQNETNRKAEIMLKAIENGQSIDPEIFKGKKKKASIKQDLLDKLNGACITSLMGVAFLLVMLFKVGDDYGFDAFLPYAAGAMLAVGIGLFVSYFVGKKMMAKEIEAEEKELE